MERQIAVELAGGPWFERNFALVAVVLHALNKIMNKILHRSLWKSAGTQHQARHACQTSP
jgi:hypothetical protein